VLKSQVWKRTVFRPREFEKRLVAIDADHLSVRSNRLRHACRDCTAAAAGIQHAKSWMKDLGKPPVVALKRSSPEYTGIGPV
jgi:hypothetical protein